MFQDLLRRSHIFDGFFPPLCPTPPTPIPVGQSHCVSLHVNPTTPQLCMNPTTVKSTELSSRLASGGLSVLVHPGVAGLFPLHTLGDLSQGSRRETEFPAQDEGWAGFSRALCKTGTCSWKLSRGRIMNPSFLINKTEIEAEAIHYAARFRAFNKKHTRA